MKNKDKNKSLKNISLIGFMGSGKSTAGIILAGRLNFLFLDLDSIIELYEGMTIPEIFKKYGEEHFREIESTVIGKVYGNKGCVFSCGGGIILRNENMRTIRKNSLVVYLEVSAENVFKRLISENDRPLLKNGNKKEKIESLLEGRRSLYEKNCDVKVNTDGRTPEEIAEIIIKKLKT